MYVTELHVSLLYHHCINISTNEKGDKIYNDDRDGSLSYMRICSSTHYFDPVTSLCKPCESNFVTTYLMSNYCVDVKSIRDNEFVKENSYLSNLAIQLDIDPDLIEIKEFF